jgi:hypothetical protein
MVSLKECTVALVRDEKDEKKLNLNMVNLYHKIGISLTFTDSEGVSLLEHLVDYPDLLNTLVVREMRNGPRQNELIALLFRIASKNPDLYNNMERIISSIIYGSVAYEYIKRYIVAVTNPEEVQLTKKVLTFFVMKHFISVLKNSIGEFASSELGNHFQQLAMVYATTYNVYDILNAYMHLTYGSENNTYEDDETRKSGWEIVEK